MVNGTLRSYYPSGVLEYQKHFRNDKAFGSCTNYYANGKAKEYALFDDFGLLQYFKIHNTNGKPTYGYGTTIGGVYCNNEYDPDTIKIGRELPIKQVIAEPPYTKVRAMVGDINEKNGIVNMKEYPVANCNITYNQKFNTPGKHKWVTIIELNDTLNKTKKIDSFYKEVVVIP